jgi:hypothetical protein
MDMFQCERRGCEGRLGAVEQEVVDVGRAVCMDAARAACCDAFRRAVCAWEVVVEGGRPVGLFGRRNAAETRE